MNISISSNLKAFIAKAIQTGVGQKTKPSPNSGRVIVNANDTTIAIIEKDGTCNMLEAAKPLFPGDCEYVKVRSFCEKMQNALFLYGEKQDIKVRVMATFESFKY